MKFLRYEMIPPYALIANPKNPRKDLGDLTELVESIKQNGIYQELTVVPHGRNQTDHGLVDAYMVVIGHRRLAAAKLAGLEELPCKVVYMDAREMQTTMLTENVQRSDLTPLEEAQGIQMCLDLGIPEADIAKEAGMSKTKIRTRKILLKYDPDMVKKSFASGATLQDYLAVEKIKNEKKREELIKKLAGTPEFTNAVNEAILEEHNQELKQTVLDAAKGVAVPIPQGVRSWELDYVRGFYLRDLKEKDKSEIKKEVIEKVLGYERQPDQKLYYETSYSGVTFYTDMVKKERKVSPEEQEREDRKRRLDANFAAITYKRSEFMRDLKKNYTPVNQHETRKRSFLYLFELLFGYFNGFNLRSENIKPIFGMDVWKDRNKVIEFMANEFDNRPAYACLLAEFLVRESRLGRNYAYSWKATYLPDAGENLKKHYEWLAQFNYRMSESEKSLIDGTHPDYMKE